VLILKIKNEFDLKHQEWLSRHDGSVPIIVISQDGSIETAIHVLQYGVFDYFSVGQNISRIAKRIREAVGWMNARPAKRPGPIRAELLLGKNEKIIEINHQARALIREEKPVVIYGETGTGKEHLAFGMYRLSCRKDSPFLNYDCRLLQQISRYDGIPVPGLVGIGLQEAKRRHAEGILFLSHVEHLNRDQQTEILDRGAHSSIRVIASYQEPAPVFEEEMTTAAAALRIPALRDHSEDVHIIAEHFVQRSARSMKIPAKSLSTEILRIMQEYPWPGNIQELSNVIERMMLIEPSGILTPDSWRICQGFNVPLNLDRANQFSNLIEDVLKECEVRWKKGSLYEEFMEQMKHMLIELVMPKVNHNQATAARVLGISRNTLREKIAARKNTL
ncbi:MAG TPA: sigma 54-interacting transcriptional regulator, partial [Acidobacteriota bacterium]|nr:sigma 54-interacting transcriptional regulator [Acidobacteriota bacterium]